MSEIRESTNLSRPVDSTGASKWRNALSMSANIAQVCLSVVAIFGYFYTVRPIYQKERLAEQVAEYERAVSEQTSELQVLANSIELSRRELATAESMRERLELEVNSLEDLIERQRIALVLIQDERDSLRNEMDFMSYEFFLSDGTPATTEEEVRIAKLQAFEARLKSGLGIHCRVNRFNARMQSRAKGEKRENSERVFPFDESELHLYESQADELPRLEAVACVADFINYRLKSAPTNDSLYITRANELKRFAISRILAEPLKGWADDLSVGKIISSCEQRIREIEAEEERKIQEAKIEYGNWAAQRNQEIREIYRNNLEVLRDAAIAWANVGRSSARVDCLNDAYELRSRRMAEVERLIDVVGAEISRFEFSD